MQKEANKRLDWLLTQADTDMVNSIIASVRNEGKDSGNGAYSTEEETELLTEMVQDSNLTLILTLMSIINLTLARAHTQTCIMPWR